jgi:hypothetical protein
LSIRLPPNTPKKFYPGASQIEKGATLKKLGNPRVTTTSTVHKTLNNRLVLKSTKHLIIGCQVPDGDKTGSKKDGAFWCEGKGGGGRVEEGCC